MNTNNLKKNRTLLMILPIYFLLTFIIVRVAGLPRISVICLMGISVFSYIYILIYCMITIKKHKNIDKIVNRRIIYFMVTFMVIVSCNITVHSLGLTNSDGMQKIKSIISSDKSGKPFQGIYVIPERPSTTKSGDKVIIENWNKTYNEIKVTPNDLNNSKSNNLSPYIDKR